MSNAETTKAFFAKTDAVARAQVLANIALNYGITPSEALAEVTADDAESLLDYVTGPARAAVSALMQRHALTS